MSTSLNTWATMVNRADNGSAGISFEEFKENVAISNRTVTDAGNALEVYHYTQQTPPNKFFRSFRGVVLKRLGDGDISTDEQLQTAYEFFVNDEHKDILSVVAHSYPYTPEFAVNDLSDTGLSDDLKDADVRFAYEGTVIRLFFADGEWRSYTHKKPANRSSWSGPKFSEIFHDCLWTTLSSAKSKCITTLPEDINLNQTYEQLQESGDFDKVFDAFTLDLNRDRCYVFLAVNHPANRIVCMGDRSLLHIQTLATSDETTLMVEVEENLGFPVPESVYVYSLDELHDFVDGLAYHLDNPGVVVFANGDIIKIVYSDYVYLADLRGNEPSLRKRYIELRGTPYRRNLFVEIYEEGQELFDSVEADIPRLAWYLHKLYLYRYVQNNFLELNQPEYILLQQCHTGYKESGTVVYEQVVIAQLNRCDPTHLNRMLRSLRTQYFTKLFEQLGIADREATTTQ